MEYIQFLTKLIELVLFVFLSIAVVYITFFGFAAYIPRKNKPLKDKLIRKFAVLIPGYKEDLVIIQVAADALKQDYPADKFEVIVIADSFKPETLAELRKLPIRVVEVVFEVSKKSKALNKCMEIIGDDYDIALVLDADNMMEPNVLNKLNDAFSRGFVAVQGHRMAKNTNTNFAILDAISEEINNHIFRKGHRAVGLSSALIGSGMAVDYGLYKKLMANIDSVGEDKELEMKLLKGNFCIEYLEDAWVYDEKTQKPEVFVNQRRRWIAAQLSHFRDFFFDGLKQFVTNGNLDYFIKVIQMIQPPRILLIGFLFILAILSLLLTLLFPLAYMEFFVIEYRYWLVIFAIALITLIVSVPGKFYNSRTFIALLSLPKGFMMMMLSLMRIKGATKRFIHTTHTHSAEETSKQKKS
jgi:cellulose synthase/poly-beta-1,6-N-acetylglucosamine synthase-like glycosyltransferase